MAWFGPKGVATMTFSLLVLGLGVEAGERIFNIAALAVFCSIIAHGLTDTPGAEWIARRAEEWRLATRRGGRCEAALATTLTANREGCRAHGRVVDARRGGRSA